MSDILGDIAQGFFSGIVANRRRRRLERGGQFEVAIRVVDGSEAGLTASWSHLIASFEPGLVRYRERFSKAIREMRVTRVDRSQQRQPAGREAFMNVNPDLRVFR